MDQKEASRCESKTAAETPKDAANMLNEFNQAVKPSSLWDDAWRRLKKNKMALVGLFIVGFYFALSVCAPLLPIYSYSEQYIIHQNLPPSFADAGKVLFRARRADMYRVAKAEGRRELSLEQKEKLALFQRELKTDPVHQRHYILGTDSLGRDIFARVIYGGRISIMIGLIGTITSLFIGVLVGSISGYFDALCGYYVRAALYAGGYY